MVPSLGTPPNWAPLPRHRNSRLHVGLWLGITGKCGHDRQEEKPEGGDDNRRMRPPFLNGWAAGFLAHLVKPVDPEVLKDHLAQLQGQ
jgi:hypothetical protein